MRSIGLLLFVPLMWAGCSSSQEESCEVGPSSGEVEAQEVQTTEERVHASARDSQKRVVFVGQQCNTYPDCSVAVWRKARDGSVDTEFGTDGLATYDSASGQNDDGYAVYIDDQDRIWVSGISNGDLALWRFLEDGSIDTSFASSGAFIRDNPLGLGGSSAKTDYGIAVVEGSGSAVILLNYTAFSGNYYGLVQVTENGSLDTSFGSSGVQDLSSLPDTSSCSLTDLVRQGNHLVAIGYDGTNYVSVKLSLAGELLTGFDADGVRNYAVAGGFVAVESAHLRFSDEGEAYVVGNGVDSGFSTARTVVMKLDSDLALDTNFDGDGFAILDRDAAYSHESGSDLSIGEHGIFVLTHARNTSSTLSRAVVRALDPDAGVVDGEFGDSGQILLEDTYGGGANRDTYETFGPGCKVLHVAGYAQNSAGTVTRGAFSRLR